MTNKNRRVEHHRLKRWLVFRGWKPRETRRSVSALTNHPAPLLEAVVSLRQEMMTPMLVLAALATGACWAAAPSGRTIVDMAGRSVTVPSTIRSVYSTSPMGEVMIYTLAPGKITGTTWNPSADERRFLVNEYNKKPVLGGWFGKNTTGNPEVIIKAKPDIVLSIGYLDKTDISAAERIERQLGTPVVMVDGRLNSLDTSYRFVGGLIGEQRRADTLARYCRQTLDTVAAVTASVQMQKRVRVYYAEGLSGLETDPKGSMHAEVLDMVGGVNVADVPIVRGYGRAAVSLEQLLLWKPEMIIVQVDHGFAHGTENFAKIMADPTWQNLDAVKNKRVYEIPSLPFGWFDRPPSVNRIIGLRWLANLLYPDRMKLDMRADTRRFYALFYFKKLNDTECAELLDRALAH